MLTPDVTLCTTPRPWNASSPDETLILGPDHAAEREATARRVADLILRDALELPDRTSPDDWPEALLITGDELHDLVQRHLTGELRAATARADEAERDRLRKALEKIEAAAASRGPLPIGDGLRTAGEIARAALSPEPSGGAR